MARQMQFLELVANERQPSPNEFASEGGKMTIFLASASSLAVAFYVYVFVQFVRDDSRVSHRVGARSESAAQLRDCTSH
jgi:hypothetical protein